MVHSSGYKRVLLVYLLTVLLSAGFLGLPVSVDMDNDTGAAAELQIPEQNDGNTRGLANSPWPCLGGNSQHTGLSKHDASKNPGRLQWKFDSDRVVIPGVIGADRTLYTGSYDGNFYAINTDGSRKWKYQTGGEIDNYGSSPAIGSDGTIYFTGSKSTFCDVIYALNPDGSLKWNCNPYNSQYFQTSIAIGSDDTIYCGMGAAIAAIYPDNGTLKWTYLTDGGISSSPAVGPDGTIYVGSDDKRLYVLSPSGEVKWSNFFGDIVLTPVIGADGTIYVATGDGKLHALKSNGDQIWNYKTTDSNPTTESFIALGSDGTVYFGSIDFPDYYIHAIKSDGTLKWEKKLPSSITSTAIGSDGTIFVGCEDKGLCAFSSDGTLKWEIEDTEVTTALAIGSDGTVYFGADDGVYAVGKGLDLPPTPPLNLKATAGDSKIDLSWEVPRDNGGADITEYEIHKGTSQYGMSLSTSVDGSIRSFSDIAIRSGVTYYYAIKAKNQFGPSEFSNIVSSSIEGTIEPPTEDKTTNSVEITCTSIDKLKLVLSSEIEGSTASLTRSLMDLNTDGVISSVEVETFEDVMVQLASVGAEQDSGVYLDDSEGTMEISKYELTGAEGTSTSSKLLTANTHMEVTFKNADKTLKEHTLRMTLFSDSFTFKMVLPDGYGVVNTSGLDNVQTGVGIVNGKTIPDEDVILEIEKGAKYETEDLLEGGLDNTTMIIIIVIIVIVVIAALSIYLVKRRKVASELTTPYMGTTQPAAPAQPPAQAPQPAQPQQYPAQAPVQAPPQQHAQQPAAQPQQQPVQPYQAPPVAEGFLCPQCAHQTTYMKKFDKWYCSKCEMTYKKE